MIYADEDQRPCPTCDGLGFISVQGRTPAPWDDREVDCPDCTPDPFANDGDEHERAEPPPYDRDPDVLREHPHASVRHSNPRWLGGTCTSVGSEYDVDYGIELRKGAA